MFRYIAKNIRRSAVTNALFCLLLVFAGALFSLAAGLWYSIYSTERYLSGAITTIAVVDYPAMGRYVSRQLGDTSNWTDAEWELFDEFDEMYGGGQRWSLLPTFITHYAAPNRMAGIHGSISEFFGSGQVQMDTRRVFGGYVEGLESPPMHLSGERPSDIDYLIQSAPQSAAAFVVYCEEVEVIYSGWSSLGREIIAHFRVEENVYVHNGAMPARTVTGYFLYTNPDGSVPVEEGKRYLIIGNGYYQGTQMPSWYGWYGWSGSAPPDKVMQNALNVGSIGSAYESQVVGEAGIEQLSTDVYLGLLRGGIVADDFPLDVTSLVPLFDPELGYEGVSWFELEGSLEDALSSEQGENISTALRRAEVSLNSLQVFTTNDMNSLFRINQRANKIIEGRMISRAEYERGARVCVISAQLAEINDLSVGDTLGLQLYPSGMRQYLTRAGAAWTYYPYHPSYPITEPVEYRIVGITQGPTWGFSDHALNANAIIIPDASFEGFDDVLARHPSYVYNYNPSFSWQENDPPLLDTVIIPNGSIPEVRAVIEDAFGEYAAFFRYYDQGYRTLMPILDNLSSSLIWILALSFVGWVIAVLMFSLFYVQRKKRDVMLLSGMGVKKRHCMRWVLVQSAAVIILAQALVMGATLPVYDNILESSLSVAEEFTESYRNYTLSEMEEAGGLELFLQLDDTRLGLLAAAAFQAAVLLSAAVFLSANTARHQPLSKRREES